MIPLLPLLLCGRYRFLLNYFECAPNLGAKLLELNFLCYLFRVDHYIYRTGKPSEIPGDCGANPALNTIANDRFSHCPPDGNPNSRFAPRPGSTVRGFPAQQVERREHLGKVPPSATIDDLEFSVLA